MILIVSRERIGRKDALRILRIFLRGLFRAGEMRYNVKKHLQGGDGMPEEMLGFLIWCAAGCLFIGFGVYALLAKRPVGFWANAEMFEVTDVKRYNRAMCKLFCGMGVVFVLLGLPLLSNHAGWIMLSCGVGVMAEIMALVLIYTQVIEKKYRKR